MRYTIATLGPCCRCGHMSRHILIADGRRVVVHQELKVVPCPVRPGDMREFGEPVEVRP